jgi:hypothetical protein
MMPLYFGPSGRALYGVYEPAAGPMSRTGALVCPPMGAEYYHSHAVCRSLCGRLAKSGVHTLRFDYLGTGDSALEPEEVGVEDWLEDIDLAARELRDMASLSAVRLIGIRAGASLSLFALHAGHVFDGVALWDPSSLENVSLDPPSSDSASRPRALSHPPLPGLQAHLPAGSLLISTDGTFGPSAAFTEMANAGGDGLAVVRHDERRPWDEEAIAPGRVPMPIRSLQTLVEWARAE